MSAKPTPGPWHAFRGRLRPEFPSKIVHIMDSNGKAIVAWGGFDAADQKPSEKFANACLMAAAPEMYACLVAAVNFAESLAMPPNWLPHARAAIAKAHNISADTK